MKNSQVAEENKKQCRLTLNCELTVGRFLEDFLVPAVGADGFICSTMS